MRKLIGAGLILGAAVCFLYCVEYNRRQQTERARQIAEAFRQMVTAIRWRDELLPLTIERQKNRPLVGKIFQNIMISMESNIALQIAWKSAFSEIEESVLSQICREVSLEGDKEHLIESLHMAVGQINRYLQQRQDKERDERRITRAAALSAAGLCIILLL